MFNRFATILFFALVITFSAISCKKKKSQSNTSNPVPNLPVNIKIYPNDPLYYKLQTIGGWMYVNGGINGLVVYRKSNEEFVAIERTSSYYPDNAAAKVKVLGDNFTLRDTVSDSRWQIIDATVTKGPAEWPLRKYGTSFDGNLLSIVN